MFKLYKSEQGQMLPCLCYVPIGSCFQNEMFTESQKNSCLLNPSADQKGNEEKRREREGKDALSKQTNKKSFKLEVIKLA